MPDFLLPDLGEGLTEAEVLAWRVEVGDHVEVDQVVASVETAKAAVDVPVPFAGTVSALHAKPGDTVTVGTPLISVSGEPGARVLVGYGPRPTARRARRPRPVSAVPERRVPVISPIVRKLARDAGLDLASIPGTGPDGLIRRRDVEHAIAAPDGERRIRLRGAQKTAAEKLTRSRREIPEATIWVDADATGLLAARAGLIARTPAAPVSLLALLARFAIAGLRRYPELNGRLDGDDLVLPAHVHLGFAAQTPRGLVVPVVRDAHLMSTRQLSAAIAQRTAAARSGQLAPADMTGGTFTVNNYGVFGVDGAAAIINHPQVAILGLGRIIERPWVAGGQVVARTVTELTLAFDHRACDGATAGGFLRYVADCVESPALALGDL